MRYVAIDSETYPIRAGCLAPKPVVWSAHGVEGSELWLANHGFPAELFVSLISADVTLVTANGPYDMAVAAHAEPVLWKSIFQAYDDGRIVDVQTLQKLIDISQGCLSRPRYDGTSGYSLADLAWHYLKRDRSEAKHSPDSWRMRYHELDGVPLEQWPPEAIQYARDDAKDTYDVFMAQRAKYGVLPSETEQYRAAWALHLMSVQGIRTDGTKVAALKERLMADRVTQRAQAQAAGFLKLTPCDKDDKPDVLVPYKRDPTKHRRMRWGKDMKAIRAKVEAAFSARGLAPPLTDGLQTSTDEDCLTRSKDPDLLALAGSGITEKLLSTYVPALEQGIHERVNTRFNVLVNNGRTSSHKDKATGAGFNFQNFPRSDETDPNAAVNFVRPCIVPTEGTYLCSIDLDTGELRSLAQVQLWLFGKSRLAEVLNAGKDPHLDFAAQLLGISYEEALANKKRPDVKKARQFGKIFNFGAPGGLGVNSLVDFARTNYDTDLSVEEAQRLRNRWERTYPEMRRYFDYISKLVGEGGARIKSFGSGMLRGDVGYTDACNHFFSNLIAQGVKDAIFYIAWECYVDRGTPLFGSRQVAMIHDETLLEVPKHAAHEAAHRARDVLLEHVGKRLPDVPPTASPALMHCWEKDAAPVYVENRLVPWERK